MSNAILTGNEERQAALRECGRSLMRRARSSVVGPDSDDEPSDEIRTELLAVPGWAATLNPTNYHDCVSSDGTPGIVYRLPADLAAAIEPHSADMSRAFESIGLLNFYAWDEGRDTTSETIRDDLAVAKELTADPPKHSPLHLEEPPAAVAANALLAHHHKSVTLNEDEIFWAADLLVACAFNPQPDEMASEQSVYPMGADRSAAAALPTLLVLSAWAEPGSPPHDQVERALLASATSRFDEVRRITAKALSRVWSTDCVPIPNQGACIHDIALRAVDASARDCRLGPRDSAGRRDPSPITGSLPDELDNITTKRLNIFRLVAPIIAAGGATATTCCVRDAARNLLDGLLRAHLRGAVLWADAGYSATHTDHHLCPAEVLFSFAARGEPDLLLRHLRAYADHGAALSQLLYDLSNLATYDPELRAALPTVWPPVLRTVLDAIDAGEHPPGDQDQFNSALSNMIPHPVPTMGDPDRVTTLENTKQDWIDPNRLSDLIVRWIPLARRSPECVDTLLDLIQTAPPTWQATTGLNWINNLIDGDFEPIAARTWRLLDWLQQLRNAGHLDATSRTTVQRIVDGLAAHGDRGAVALQHADEQLSA